jgi:hypothetical protein
MRGGALLPFGASALPFLRGGALVLLSSLLLLFFAS